MSIGLWISAIGIVSSFMVGLISLVVILYGRRAPQFSRPPGWVMQRFAELFFSEKTFIQVLEPALSDMQSEHFEALAAGRLWNARMVLMRGYWSFWSAALAQLPISFAQRIYEIWKATKAGS